MEGLKQISSTISRSRHLEMTEETCIPIYSNTLSLVLHIYGEHSAVQCMLS